MLGTGLQAVLDIPARPCLPDAGCRSCCRNAAAALTGALSINEVGHGGAIGV